MKWLLNGLTDPRRVLFIGALVSVLLLAGAHAFEHLGGLAPCPLCLDQREVHWVALAVTLVGAMAYIVLGGRSLQMGAIGAASGVFAWSAGLATYHAGVEWKLWQGPKTCEMTSDSPDIIQDAGDILGSLDQMKGVPCDEAAWRLFGISMAGYNALISLALAGIMLGAFWRVFRRIPAPNGPAPVATTARLKDEETKDAR